MTAMSNTHAAFTIRSIGGMWHGDCECGTDLGDHKDAEALVDALHEHWDNEETTK